MVKSSPRFNNEYVDFVFNRWDIATDVNEMVHLATEIFTNKSIFWI